MAKTQRHWRESHAWLSGRDAALARKPREVPEWWTGQFEQDWLRGYEKGEYELAVTEAYPPRSLDMLPDSMIELILREAE